MYKLWNATAHLELAVDVADKVRALDGEQEVAAREPAGVLLPRLVLRFPVAQGAVAAETLDVVACAHVEEAGLGQLRRTLFQAGRPIAERSESRL